MTIGITRIFTFGWSPEFVVRPLLEEGLNRMDVIVLIASKPETDYARRRAEEAYRQVESFVKMVGAALHYREVDVNKDVIPLCRDVVKVIKEFDMNTSLKFYLTGGMRALIVATLIVAKLLSSAGRHINIVLSREDGLLLYTLPVSLLNLDIGSITNVQAEILRFLKVRSGATFEDLAIGRTAVTVRKHLTKLREKRLVSFIARGRKQVYSLTPLGELMLDILD